MGLSEESCGTVTNGCSNGLYVLCILFARGSAKKAVELSQDIANSNHARAGFVETLTIAGWGNGWGERGLRPNFCNIV